MSDNNWRVSATRRGEFTGGSWLSARPEVALRIAYLLMLACAGYAPFELTRLIVWHHDTYDDLTLVPIFGLELAVLALGYLGLAVAGAHAWLWVFGVRDAGQVSAQAVAQDRAG